MEKKPQKKPKKYICEICHFSSSDKKDYRRHLATRKHQKKANGNEMITKKTAKIVEKNFSCHLCRKKYKYKSGLSRHFTTSHPNYDINLSTSNIKYTTTTTTHNSKHNINSQVDELREMMEKIVKIQQTTSDNFDNLKKRITEKIGNTTYNNKMSINVYLNHYCKDALNMQDFIDNLKISLDDLNYTKEHGYAKGISNIFVKQLRDLKPNERPIHCSDKKRLQFYVKDNNCWEKDAEHKKIDSTIQDITIKQIKQLKEWEKKHPNYLKDEHLLKEWHNLVHNVMGGEDIEDKQKNKNTIKKELGITFEMKDDLLENH